MFCVILFHYAHDIVDAGADLMSAKPPATDTAYSSSTSNMANNRSCGGNFPRVECFPRIFDLIEV